MGLDYIEKYDIAGEASNNVLGKVPGFAVATAADVVSTLWNSLPFTPEVKTEDMLSRVSKDALAVYQENPETVHLASFVAGALAPGGVTMKLLGKAREGTASLGYMQGFVGASFTGTRQRVLANEIELAFRQAGSATAEYQSLRRQLYAANATQQVIDNAIVELAILGTMNAHPFMEDYLKDPLKNFAIGAGVGGVLGAAFAIPLTNASLRGITRTIEGGAAKDILDSGFKPVTPSITTAGRVQAHTENIRNLGSIIDDVDKDPFIRGLASSIRLQETEKRAEALIEAFPKYKDATPELKQIIADVMGDSRFIGVDFVRFVNMDKFSKTGARLALVTDPSNPTLYKLIEEAALKADPKTPVTVPTNFIDKATGKAAVVFYRPSTGEAFAAEGARNAALAADIADVQTIIKGATGYGDQAVKFAVPHLNFAENNLYRAETSARQDLQYLLELKATTKLDLTKAPHVVTAPDQLPRMNALVSWMAEDPAVRGQVKVQIRSDYPTYKEAEEVITKTVGPNHTKNLDAIITQPGMEWRSQRGLSSAAIQFQDEWVAGRLDKFRRAMDAYLRGTPLPAGEAGNKALAEELWNAGKVVRDAFRKEADADGYVYLYRGTTKSPKGAAAAESYSTRLNVAKRFGTPHLYKVHVDNIIGTVGKNRFGEYEVVVGSPHHAIVSQLPTGSPTTVSATAETAQAIAVPLKASMSSSEMTLQDLSSYYLAEVNRQVKELIGMETFSIEEIAARMNLNKDAVVGIMAGQDIDNMSAFRYTDAKQIDDYVGVKNKLMALAGNPRKNPLAGDLAALDRRQQSVANKDITRQLTISSRSDIARTMDDMFSADGMVPIIDNLIDQVHTAVNSAVGDPRMQSADNALRGLTTGPVVTYLGKKIIDHTDKIKAQFLEPIATSMLTLRNNAVALAEFNKVVNTLAGLKGWRDIMQDEKGVWRIVQKEVVGKQLAYVPVKDADGTAIAIRSPSVVEALNSTRTLSDELLRLHNLNRTLLGQKPVNDLGFYMPPISLVNKAVAYVITKGEDAKTQLLVANNAEELASMVAAYKKVNADKVANGIVDVVTKADQEAYNLAKGYTDYQAYIEYANVAFQHKGASALAIVPPDTRMIENTLQSFENMILQGTRRYTETYLHDAMYWLDEMSTVNKQFAEGQPKRGLFKDSAKDGALVVKNILLGRDQLEQSVGLKAVNNLTDFLLNRASQTVDKFLENTRFGQLTGEHSTKEYFDGLNKKLADAGIKPIWSSFDEYLATTRTETRNIAPGIVSAGNGLLATMQLRMFEVAQAAVNMMSLPILTWSALMERLPGTVVGADGVSMKMPLRIMYDGIRHMHTAQGRALSEQWAKEGFIDQAVRQYTELTTTLKQAYLGGSFTQRAIDAANKIQEHPAIKLLSKPSDWAEQKSREIAMHVGYQAAKHAYPGIDDTGATIAAVAFTDRAIGNYHAAQRPTMFQGTFGAAIGLYQTYFLTYAQHVYRGLESRNFQQLATIAAAQAGIFGMASWPGYNLLSEQIVGKMNDNHVDLTTGTFRAVGDTAAEIILYGLPSSLGPAFYTRGDVSPRIPSAMGDIAVFNGVKEGWNAAANIINKAAQGISQGTPVQSLFEALSMQSLNRPIARWSELVTQSTVTGQGNTVTPTDEFWTVTGTFARLLGTRPLEEQVVRNGIHLNKFYETLDHDRRQAVTSRVKTAVRDGDLDGELLSKAAADYIRAGGNAKGWTAAMNEVMVKSEAGARYDLLRKLEPNSPLRTMLNDMY